ncbi:MAG: hypothetical protein AAFQ36_00430 [Pseudomonadota bacterium]
MKESVFEAYLEDGEELLWEGFCSRDRSFPFDFQAPADRWTSIHGFEKMWILVLAIYLIFLVYMEASNQRFIGGSAFLYLIIFNFAGTRLLRQIIESDAYLNGVAQEGFVFAVTSNRLLMYNYSTKQLSRRQAITSELTVVETARGLTINSPGAKKWVWPLWDASARTALEIIREARDRVKEEAT